MNRIGTTLCIATAAAVLALGGITYPPKSSPASFKPDMYAKYTAQISDLQDQLDALTIQKLEAEKKLAAALRPIITAEPKLTHPQQDCTVCRGAGATRINGEWVKCAVCGGDGVIDDDPRDPEFKQSKHNPVMFVRGDCANGSCSLGSGPVRSVGSGIGRVGRGIGRVGRRIGWRVTHPFGGRLRRR